MPWCDISTLPSDLGDNLDSNEGKIEFTTFSDVKCYAPYEVSILKTLPPFFSGTVTCQAMRICFIISVLRRKFSLKYKVIFILLFLTLYFIWRFFDRVEPEHTKGLYNNIFDRYMDEDSVLYGMVRKHDGILSHDQSCVHPYLDPNHASVSNFFHGVLPIQCNKEQDWIVTENGTFWISEAAKLRHGDITCLTIPLLRGADDYKIKNGKGIKFNDGVQRATTDFFRASCWAQDGAKYFNVHATIAVDKHIMHRLNQANCSSVSMPFNLLMIGFDSVSRLSWFRKLPQTQQYFDEVLKGVVLTGYNIVGDGTPQALLPILTGKTEYELPEARRGNPSATTVDGHPWIWKEFHKEGYITQWAEDMAHIGTFNFRMMGFKNQPVDHYMRPFYLAAEKMYAFNNQHCLGSTPRHRVMLNWIRDSFIMYPRALKFVFGFHSEYSHKNVNDLQLSDEDLKELLHFLYEGSFLDNTILILMSDHGSRFHEIRQTVQGKYEERMPYFAFRFPTAFIHDFPKAYETFRKNANRLTTPFDIHETFVDILNYSVSREVINKYGRGISLFKEIPRERTCFQAGIDPHWCACLSWKVKSISSTLVKNAVTEVLKFINNLTKTFRGRCHFLILKNIQEALTIKGNENILNFEGSMDNDGRLPNITHTENSESILLQITFRTVPGNGLFEATVLHVPTTYNFYVDANQISRLNAYGNSAYCISKDEPNLRQFCYCMG